MIANREVCDSKYPRSFVNSSENWRDVLKLSDWKELRKRDCV